MAEPPLRSHACASSDPAACAEAVGQYQHRLYRYFLRLVRDAATADDLFQQTWLHVVRQLHRYDSTRSFDYLAVRHRTQRRHGPASPSPQRASGGSRVCASPPARRTPSAQSSPGTRRHPRGCHGGAARAISEALTLRFEEGMKLEEIAEVTHTPLSTVKSRVRRGLEAMKQKICKEDIV